MEFYVASEYTTHYQMRKEFKILYFNEFSGSVGKVISTKIHFTNRIKYKNLLVIPPFL